MITRLVILHIIIPWAKARPRPRARSRARTRTRTRARAQETFISRRSSNYYVCIEETYAIIQRAHIATGHAGRDRMLKHFSTNYANITRECVGLFKSCVCLARSHKLRKVIKCLSLKVSHFVQCPTELAIL